MSNKDNNNIACRSALKIGIIGGTGGMGKGFALRWCPKHEILIGSRDAQRASASASEYVNEAQQVYGTISGSISGKDNLSVARESEIGRAHV